ncbi:MAG: UDP-N-acetylmuramoyl-L-alanyl-D-glutamate--2,6-diaminopimelate ligase [Phycisphaerales bacterium]|nr:UDP-N-acetylmuramoyl-L-alanyl-D-glutamate--2,6-diaminopimelate ligase [Phycisphaerales bacterium]
MILADLIQDSGLRCLTPDKNLGAIRICDITEDSRTAVPGSLFIARSGTRSDGNKYIEPAIQCGTVAILTDRDDIELPPRSDVVVFVSDNVQEATAQLAERFYGYPARSLLCAGVTGTNGKTTIVHLAHQLIESAGIRCGLIGTVEIDDGRQRARADMTTPPAVEMSRTLSTMIEHGCKAVVMEVSSHALDQRRVGAIKFDAGAFTNLSGDHLDYHQTLEHYTNSKSRLFSLLKPNATAVINADDDASSIMFDACPNTAVKISCSNTNTSDSYVEIRSQSIAGMDIKLVTSEITIEAVVPIFGRFNAMNILQAMLLAQQVMSTSNLNIEEQVAYLSKALPRLTLPMGRLEHVETIEDDIVVLVDFAHTDDALASALGAVRDVSGRDTNICCVFGCGGNRDTSKRARMGEVADRLSDSIVITSDNPRTEPPNKIIEEIINGIDPSNRSSAHIQSDRARAIHFAISNAASGDIVIIAGKGHETEQISPDGQGGTRVAHFDDREHARTALRERRLRRSDQPEIEAGKP